MKCILDNSYRIQRYVYELLTIDVSHRCRGVTLVSRDVARCRAAWCRAGVTRSMSRCQRVTRCRIDVAVWGWCREMPRGVALVSRSCHAMSCGVTQCHKMSYRCREYVISMSHVIGVDVLRCRKMSCNVNTTSLNVTLRSTR